MPLLRCEIEAPEKREYENLSTLASRCAGELGFSLVVTRLRQGKGADDLPRITLRLPLEAVQHNGRAWCLACRLTAYCQRARVSVEVSAQDAFSRAGRPLKGLRKRAMRAVG